MPRVAELCGLPGSGKSTLARGVLQTLEHRGVPVMLLDAPICADVPRNQRLARRVRLATSELTRHPVSARARVLLAGASQPPRDTVAGIAQWLAVRRLVRDARRDSAHHLALLEEGQVQTVWTLLLRTDRGADARWWGPPHAPRCDVVIHVDVPVAVAADRLDRRPSRHSRTQRLPATLRRAELEHGARLLESILALCPVPVVRVDGALPPERLAVQVADLLLEHPH